MIDTEKQFEALVNTIPQLVWMAKPDGEVYWYNDQFYAYTGVTFEEGWAKVADPEFTKDLVGSWKSAIALGEPWECVLRLKGKDGQYRWFMTRVTPIRGENGEIIRWVGTNTDVDEQTRLQRQLTDTLDSMSDSFFAIDKDWKITQVNDILLKRAKLKREDIMGKDFRDVFLSSPEAKESKYWSEYHRLMKDRVPVNFEEYYAPYEMWTAVRAYPTSEGGMTVFSPEITAQKRAEREMLAAKLEAERANELKSAFLANMSHEIRTPLGAMIGFADLLRDRSLTESERAGYLEILARNGEQLSVIINDILDLSKVEAGHLNLEFLPTKPDVIATEVVSLLRMKAQEKGVALDYVFAPSVPASVISDPVRVRQVLLNLVNNAIKFTSKGTVRIKSSGFSNESGRRYVRFEIADTGIGISDDQRGRLFEMFVQADGSMTRRFGGTGLGLALSRKLARSLGGDVFLKASAPGVGSTFVFTFEDHPELNATPEPATIEQVLGDHPLEGTRVLVVDDSPDNREMVSRFLTKAGAHVALASNGIEGYMAALSGNFDIVLMDIQMPVMDGYTATERLREQGFKQPIIALTAHALNEVRKKALSVGCTDHMAKPINAKALVATVARYSHAP